MRTRRKSLLALAVAAAVAVPLGLHWLTGRAEWFIAPLTPDGKVVRRRYRILPES